jgi:hypothetical protein
MNHRKVLLLTALLATCFAVANCKKTAPDPNDSSAPTVVIKIRGTDGQYAPATQTNLGVSGGLDFMCQVEDPQGVKSIALTYATTGNTCTVNSAVYSGSFPITPLPTPATQDLQPDSSGNVLTSVPLFSQIGGPLHCNVPSVGQGSPYGREIKVNCTGKNWSSNNAVNTKQETLTVKLQ